MIETFIALLLAHVLADFVFQSDWIANGKQDRDLGALAAHFAFVLGFSWLAVGTLDPMALAVIGVLSVTHMLIDLAKSFFKPSLTAFIGDQVAHLATLIAAAHFAPDLWAASLWSGVDWLPGLMGIVAGFLIATRAGEFVMQFLMAQFDLSALPTGLANGGKLIGRLERGIIYVFVMVGEPAGIGFLIAAKSVLRFDTTREDQRASEYVIIGTLASFGWAMAVAWSALAIVSRVAPLGILPPAS